MPEFTQWLHDVKDDNTSGGRKICRKKSNSQAWESHPKGSKHLIELEKVTTFFGKLLTPKMTSLKQSLIHQHPNHQANY